MTTISYELIIDLIKSMAKYRGRRLANNLGQRIHHSYDKGHKKNYMQGGTIIGTGFEKAVDKLADADISPALIDGNLALAGRESNIMVQLDDFNKKSISQDETAQGTQAKISQLNVAVVGKKV